jgi:mono/diheme cytochrome c family protein
MQRGWLATAAFGLVWTWVAVSQPATLSAQQQGAPAAPDGTEQALVDQYCVRCHNDRALRGGLSLDGMALSAVADHTEVWEKAVRKLRAGAMPPAGAPRPTEADSTRLLGYLERTLDDIATAAPNPGRTDTFRRLNRTEYRNAVRDLLALDVDVATLLPRDDASFGFDNVGVGELSPTLMERYLAAAQKISRLAVGSLAITPGSRVVTLRPDLTQEGHVDGLPFGTRGGTVVEHTFPLDGEYQIEVRLARNRNENVEGLRESHVVEVTLDGARLKLFTVTPNRNRLGAYYSDEEVDKHLNLRIPVTAGPHALGAAFLQKNSALIETERQPYQAQFNQDRHPRQQPAVHSVSVTGPFDPTGAGETPSRDQIFACRPATAADEADCAATIISSLTRRAYRRPVTYRDLEMPLAFYEQGHAGSDLGSGERGGFDAGIELALRALLTSPEFLFRIERDAEDAAPGAVYQISEIELASRLSFFLWSSIPDDTLIDLAEAGRLRDPGVLETQVRRMLADPRAAALTTNFADQWLYLRNLDSMEPNLRLFPDFDDNLRSAFRRETQMLFASMVSEDRNVVDLLRSDYTFLNERLARHYGIPGVYGTQFRRVALPGDSVRRGLLGHGSILTVTSYATRTSPVLRGKWILENLLGMPPPPPPPNVPALEEPEPGVAARSMRERMEQHRANAVCATCHRLMDPAGLSMENFDAIGRWRDRSDDRLPIDASGSIPGGGSFEGVTGLRDAMLARPEVFVGTMTEKLLTYALGRGVDHHDGPAVRQIVRVAADADNRFSALVLGIVESTPFQMRRSQ